MFRKKSFWVITTLAVLVLALGGIAFALWSSSGTGSGRATATSAQAATVTASTGAADLYPGTTAGAVRFTITNPNPYAITFTSMTAGTVASANPTLCPDINVTVASATGLTLTVAANSTSAPLSIANVVSMVAEAPDGCQGMDFDVALTLAGAQS